MKIWKYMLVVLLLAICVVPVSASTFTGAFAVEIGGSSSDWNVLTSGSGDGFVLATGAGGPWFSYQDPNMVLIDPWGQRENKPQWWNQWYYDGVYDPSRRKVVDISFSFGRIDPKINGFGTITINWSTPEWSALGQNSPPMVNTDPNGVSYIGRYTLNDILQIEDDATHTYSVKDIWLPIPYNPEWVSIDVRGYNFWITDGKLVHSCVPEPGSLLVIGSGVIGLLGFKLRRK